MALHSVYIALLLGLVVPQELYAASLVKTFTERVRSIFLEPSPEDELTQSSQTIPVLKPTLISSTKEDDDTFNDPTVLSATTGSLRMSTEDIDFPLDDTISVYEVKKGDTLAAIAKLFNVSKNTIMWANNMSSEKVTPGDTLVILPVTGIKHTVKKGDTLASVAKKYKAEVGDIAIYNGIAKDSALALGDVIIVPDGEITVSAPVTKPVPGKKTTIYTQAAPTGFLIRPIVTGIKTQGIHGHNAIDIGVAQGTPLLASANGKVLVTKMGGYNGGYGNMIIIAHAGNVQTVYAHLKEVYVTAGDIVVQGQIIGATGNTGNSTGPHLHFEVRGAKNPF